MQREVNLLSDGNRGVRKRALEKICNQVISHNGSSQVILNGLLNFLLKPLLKVFSDPVEKCRDLSIGFLIKLVKLFTLCITLSFIGVELSRIEQSD